ncbi:MAG: SMC-Scp complex subunit ScpB [Candidatus Aenigmatarchaeota archaeon]
MSDIKKLKAKIEALLFASSRPLSLNKICNILSENEENVKEALKQLIEEYSNPEKALEIIETPEGYEMIIKAEYRNYASQVASFSDLNQGALKTLALIILQHPIKQSDIVRIQGNRAYDYIKMLERKGLISSKKVGKTKILLPSENLEKYFGMKIEDIKEQLRKYIQ